eukprot:scaffold111946_cov30-Tisochrysis_lutea.AAC.2
MGHTAGYRIWRTSQMQPPYLLYLEAAQLPDTADAKAPKNLLTFKILASLAALHRTMLPLPRLRSSPIPY